MENTELLSLANYEKAMYVVAQLAMYTNIYSFTEKRVLLSDVISIFCGRNFTYFITPAATTTAVYRTLFSL